jgi:hypothetical protein
MSVEYRPLWWRPWLDTAPPLPTDAESPDVTGFQLPESPAPAEPPAGAEPPSSAD